VLGGAAVGQVQQHHVAGGAFKWGVDRRAVALAEDEVAFPIAQLSAVVDAGVPLADQGAGVDEPGGALAGVASASTCLATRAQCGRPAAQTAAVGQVDRLVDGFVRQVALRLVGDSRAQRPADLFGAPALAQALLDVCLQLRVAAYLAVLRTRTPHGGALLRVERVVRAGAWVAVAAYLPADRGGAAADLPGDRAQRVAGPQQVGDGDALLLGEKPWRDGGGFPLFGDRRKDVITSRTVDDLAPVAPPVAGLAMDPYLAARSRVAHPLRHEPKVVITLVRQGGLFRTSCLLWLPGGVMPARIVRC
jgi:hypothetical protein